ncbi:PH domain leucine-rich repeat-containing protein phosphatase 2 isoform X1 [Lissotriton helveticus]
MSLSGGDAVPEGYNLAMEGVGDTNAGPPEPCAPVSASRKVPGIRVLKRNMKRAGSRTCLNRRTCFGSRERDWLREDVRRGCVYIYGVDPVPSTSSDLRLVLCTVDTSASEICAGEGKESIYMQQHGGLVRSLDSEEKPLQIVHKYLAELGFEDPLRIQEEATHSDIGCMIRFYSEKPCQVEQLDRIMLSGIHSVRKGKTQLHKWAERQVVLCGTCLIVSSVKNCQAGKMHILPLVGGKVEEVKRRQHCLALSSAGAQAQTYHVCFESFADYQRWHRQASKVVSQQISMVDLSCYSLEEVPEYLFYSQDLTYLNLRHNFLKLDGPGALSNLCRFAQLKSLNLSHNRLGAFPTQLCEICTLTELNLSCNGLIELPIEIGNLQSLQTLNLDGNSLTFLPDELGNLQQLTSLGLSFNDLITVPAVYGKLISLEKIAMAGNQMEMLSLGLLSSMTHLKHVDLRMNLLKKVISEGVDELNHIAHLDLRDNQLIDLDLSGICGLEQLHCERNQLRELTVCGLSSRALYAGSNRLTTVNVYPVPCLLTTLDLSRNRLEYVPDWACEAKKLEVLDLSYNLLTDLPGRLLSCISLQKLFVGHNRLQSLPSLEEHVPLETLDVQHNLLTRLPATIFTKALNLRCLNASANGLEFLPVASDGEETSSELQHLYLTNNNLTDECIPALTGHSSLRVLRMANNQLQMFPASKLNKLELLEELNLSCNQLKAIPTTVANCKTLQTLIAHSNHINVFPEIFSLPQIQLVDLSCNDLTEILIPETLPTSLQELDLTGNANLVLDHRALDVFSHITTLNIDQKLSLSADSTLTSTFWKHGLAEMSGQRNKLCVSSLAVNDLAEGVDVLYGMFDGKRNEEVPRLLQCTMGDVLLEEVQKSTNDKTFMSNTFLVSHRKLGIAGQKLGSSALMCYIRHHTTEASSSFTMTAANVGTCQAILCRNGQPLPLSRVFTLEQCPDEFLRIKEQKAILTEDNKINGVTCCTRMLGCTYLHPWVLPKPHIFSITLTVQDEFLILGNRGLWENMSHIEAVKAIRHVPDPLAAAKKLCTLAQSYGCQDNVAAMVVCLNVGEDSCTCQMQGLTLPSHGGFHSTTTKETLEPVTASSSSGIASEFNSELSASEVSSEVGSTASDEHMTAGPEVGLVPRPERRCSLHPIPSTSVFQRQPSCATFSSNQSDNGLDSDDEPATDGIVSNGRKVEVEVDIHCLKLRSLETSIPTTDEGLSAAGSEEDCGGLCFTIRRKNSSTVSSSAKERDTLHKSPSTSCLFGKKLSNGSVVPLEESLNVIEVATEAPKRKTGYFSAPTQQDLEDKFVVPPDLEEEVKEQLKHHQEMGSAAGPNKEDRTIPPEEFDTAL